MLPWTFFAGLDAMFTGAASVMQKRALFQEHALEMVTLVSIFCAIITAPLFLLYGTSPLSQHALALIFLQALLVAGATLLFAKSLRHLPISVAGPILVFSPVLSALFAYVFMGESLSAVQIVGIVIVVLGAHLLEAQWERPWEPLVKAFTGPHTRYAMGAMLLYAAAALLERRIVAPVAQGGLAVPPALFLATEQLAIAAIYLPVLFFFQDGYEGIRHGARTAAPVILLIAILTVGYRFAGSFALSFPEGKLGLFTAIKRTSVLFAVAIGGSLFHEEGVQRRIFACVVMLIGTAMILI